MDIKNENIEEPDLAAEMPARARLIRDRFVEEYMVDYNAQAAAARIGYNASISKEYGARFMQEPYVLQQIKLKSTTPTDESPDVMKQRIIQGLLREANYFGAGSTASARVAALGRLATIQGLDAPSRSRTELTGADGQPLNAGGVFVVPGLMTTEEWEQAAKAQQAQLTAPETPSVH